MTIIIQCAYDVHCFLSLHAYVHFHVDAHFEAAWPWEGGLACEVCDLHGDGVVGEAKGVCAVEQGGELGVVWGVGLLELGVGFLPGGAVCEGGGVVLDIYEGELLLQVWADLGHVADVFCEADGAERIEGADGVFACVSGEIVPAGVEGVHGAQGCDGGADGVACCVPACVGVEGAGVFRREKGVCQRWIGLVGLGDVGEGEEAVVVLHGAEGCFGIVGAAVDVEGGAGVLLFAESSEGELLRGHFCEGDGFVRIGGGFCVFVGIDDAHRCFGETCCRKIAHEEHGELVCAVQELGVFRMLGEAAEGNVGGAVFGAVVLADEKLVDEAICGEAVEALRELSAFLMQVLIILDDVCRDFCGGWRRFTGFVGLVPRLAVGGEGVVVWVKGAVELVWRQPREHLHDGDACGIFARFEAGEKVLQALEIFLNVVVGAAATACDQATAEEAVGEDDEVIGGFSLFFEPAPENCGVCGIEKIIHGVFWRQGEGGAGAFGEQRWILRVAGTAVQRHEGDQRRWVEGFFCAAAQGGKGQKCAEDEDDEASQADHDGGLLSGGTISRIAENGSAGKRNLARRLGKGYNGGKIYGKGQDDAGMFVCGAWRFYWECGAVFDRAFSGGDCERISCENVLHQSPGVVYFGDRE